jgi:hypothetical protein
MAEGHADSALHYKIRVLEALERETKQVIASARSSAASSRAFRGSSS